MASFLAVEYGTARVRFLEFDGSRRNVRIVAVGEADIDITAAEGEGEDVANDLRAERIAEAMEEAGFALDPSVMSFPASRAVFRWVPEELRAEQAAQRAALRKEGRAQED